MPSNRDALTKEEIKKDIMSFVGLFKSHDLDTTRVLHADNNYFCKNIKKMGT